MQIIAISVLVLAAALAQAKTYTVKQGDCLSVIADSHHVRFRELLAANKQIKDPNKIRVGQKITIPRKGKAKSVKRQAFAGKTADGYALVKTLGRHVFGKKRSTTKAIKMFSLSEEVIQLFIAEVKANRFTWIMLKKGDRREQMVFGEYKIQSKIEFDFPEGHEEAARRYSVEWQGWIYHLDVPLKCDNPTWSREPKPEPTPEPEPPAPEPEPEPEKPAPVCPECPACPVCPDCPQPQPEPAPKPKEPEEPEKEVIRDIPKEEEKKAPAPQPIVEKQRGSEWESYSWLGHYKSLEGNGQSSYYGGKLNFFPIVEETSLGIMRVGIGSTINGWNGKNNGFNFWGDRWTVGPVVDLITDENGTKFTSTVQLGWQKDRGRNSLGYRSRQKTKILYFGEGVDLYNIGPFKKIESWFDANIKVGHDDKDSRFRGRSISGRDDPAENKTVFGFGSRLYLLEAEHLHGGVSIKLDYAVGGHSTGVETGLFIADKYDIVKAGAGLRHQFNSKFDSNNGSSVGIGLDLDISKTIDKIMGYLKDRKEKKP